VDDEPSKAVLQKLGDIAAIEELVFLKLWGSWVDGSSLWFCRLIIIWGPVWVGFVIELQKHLSMSSLTRVPYFPVTWPFWGLGLAL
jgi:hypothetical protein